MNELRQSKIQEKYEQIRNLPIQAVPENKHKKVIKESSSQTNFRLMKDDMREIMEVQAKIAKDVKQARKNWTKSFENRH